MTKIQYSNGLYNGLPFEIVPVKGFDVFSQIICISLQNSMHILYMFTYTHKITTNQNGTTYS